MHDAAVEPVPATGPIRHAADAGTAGDQVVGGVEVKGFVSKARRRMIGEKELDVIAGVSGFLLQFTTCGFGGVFPFGLFGPLVEQVAELVVQRRHPDKLTHPDHWDISCTGHVEAADYPATFSPMTFSVAGGKVKTSELWMTAPDMAVGFQGNVDLTSNTIDQMSVALLGASLYTFPGSRELFQGLVKPTQVIEMPLGGSLSAPKPKPVDFAVNTPLAIAEGALGEDAGRIIGVIRDLGREAQPWQKRRPRFEWHPSADALAFAGKFKPAEQPATQPAGDAEQPAEATPEQPQQQQEEPQEEKSIEERLEEEAIRAGTGLLRDLLNSRRSQ